MRGGDRVQFGKTGLPVSVSSQLEVSCNLKLSSVEVEDRNLDFMITADERRMLVRTVV